MKNKIKQKRKGFIGIEVAIVASIILLTGFAALNSFNARATNAKDSLIGQFQNSQLNLNGSSSGLSEEHINQLKQEVINAIDIQSIRLSVLNLMNIPEIKEELMRQIDVEQIKADILESINVDQIKADVLATVNVPQIKADIVAEINVPQIKTDIIAAFPTDAATLGGLPVSSFVRSDVNDGKTPGTASALAVNQNLNLVTAAGFYYQPNAVPTGSNYPIARGGSLLVQRGVGNVSQIYTTDQGNIYTRTWTSSWSAWVLVWNSGNH